MRVAVLHYHLRRGGVTRVIENAATSLAGQEVELLALSGENYTGEVLAGLRNPGGTTTAKVAGLGYHNEAAGDEGRALADALERAARERFGALPDLWHIHNHSLGKNVDFPGALRHLLERGARVLLQIHDFAEDGRPENYARQRAAMGERFEELLYPDAPQVHYAVLNGRDRAILAAAGVPDDRLHLLPNAVAVPAWEPADERILPEVERLILYPTRAIRRKNVGEMLLLAALARETQPGTVFATTLRPENPEWQTIHDDWEALAQELELPARFGLGLEFGFEQLIARADALLTTSVAEGFGLAFLEPFLFRQPVVGRDLPDITGDFKQVGVRLSGLYQRLPVPAEMVNADAPHAAIEAALARSFAAFGREPPPHAVEQAMAGMLEGDAFDFGRLDEPRQAAIIRQVRRQPHLLPRLDALLQPAPAEVIETNRRAIAETFGLSAYGERLRGIYHRIVDGPTGAIGALPAAKVLDAFLDPAQLNLLRS